MVRNSNLINFLLIALLIAPVTGWCYRPFDSTDADVVDRGEIEIELGYFNWERADGEDTFITPQLVFNYGLSDTLELVAEFDVEHASGEDSQLVDPALFLKGILREGLLQDRTGLSFAVEAGLLLPSTIAEEDKVGFEAIGIVSGQLSPLTYHVNFGGGLEREHGDAFGLWGLIVELPLSQGLRLVGEINGETIDGERPENSGLIGLIWEPPSLPDLALDLGVRRGISSAAPDWQLTIGLAVGW